MPTLRATRTYRADTTARARRPGGPCTLSVSDQGDALELSFAREKFVVAIGKSDLSLLVEEAVSQWPELGAVLAGKAAGTLATLLEMQRAFPGTVATKALKRLVQVDHHLDALAEQELPSGARRQVISAGNALESARGTLEAL